MNESFRLIDQSFDFRHPENYQSCIQLSKNTFGICFSKKNSNKIVALQEKSLSTERLLEWEKLEQEIQKIQLPYEQNKLFSINSENFCFIPKAIFKEEQIPQLLALNGSPVKNQHILIDEIEQLELFIGYSINNSLHRNLTKNFQNIRFTHHLSTLIKGIASDFSTNEQQLFCHVKNKQLTLVYFNKQGFQFANQFVIQTAEDYIYYVLFVCEQLKIQPYNCKLILLGNIVMGKKIHHYSYNYFSKIQFGESKNNFNLAPALTEKPAHLFYTLYKEIVCES